VSSSEQGRNIANGCLTCSLSKTPMVVGGREVLVYTTLGGSVGALIPFTSKSDVEFMTDLEMVRSGLIVAQQFR
jgi:splicing factor 3B subunit 3